MVKKFLKSLKFWGKKKQEAKDIFTSIGYTYIMECQRDTAFRARMEKTKFGKMVATKLNNLTNAKAK